MRLGKLCRSLPARGRAIRAELPHSQVRQNRLSLEPPAHRHGAGGLFDASPPEGLDLE